MLIDAKRQRKGRHLFDPDLDPRISQHVAKVRDDGAISIEATVETRNNSSTITFSGVSSMAGQPGCRFHDGLNNQKKPSFSFSILDTQPSPKPKKRKRTKFFSRGRHTTGPLLETNANVNPTAAMRLSIAMEENVRQQKQQEQQKLQIEKKRQQNQRLEMRNKRQQQQFNTSNSTPEAVETAENITSLTLNPVVASAENTAKAVSTFGDLEDESAEAKRVCKMKNKANCMPEETQEQQLQAVYKWLERSMAGSP